MTRLAPFAFLLPIALVAGGCGAAAVQSAAPPVASPDAPPVSPAPSPTAADEVPSSCAASAVPGVCAAGPRFAAQACRSARADLALRLLAKGAPWSRAYATRNLSTWTSSGLRPVKTTLSRGEEVVVLAAHAPNAMFASAPPTYEVMRWDGTCARLEEGEVVLRAPARPARAAIPWQRLDGPTRERLLTSARVRDVAASRAKACEVSAADDRKCDAAEQTLTVAIADYVASGRL